MTLANVYQHVLTLLKGEGTYIILTYCTEQKPAVHIPQIPFYCASPDWLVRLQWQSPCTADFCITGVR